MSYQIRPTINGYQYDEVVSALQKAIRRGEEEAAVYWVLELSDSGYSQAAFRRLMVIAVEDVGVEGDAQAIVQVMACYQAFHDASRSMSKAPETRFLVQAVVYLARAPKSRNMDHLENLVKFRRLKGQKLEIPDHAKDCHTAAGKDQGRHWGHFCEFGAVVANRKQADSYERAMCQVCTARLSPDERKALLSKTGQTWNFLIPAPSKPVCDGTPIERRQDGWKEPQSDAGPEGGKP